MLISAHHNLFHVNCTVCKLMRRTSSIPKKVSSADQPTIALVDASSTKGHVVLIATCKLQTTFIVNGSNLASYATRFPMMQSMQAIRKLVSAKSSTSVNCLVLYNVCMKRGESTSHPFECKLRAGWGVASLSTAYHCMDKFVTKTTPSTTQTEGNDSHASDALMSSAESQTCARALQADESVESRGSHESSASALHEGQPGESRESHATGNMAHEADVVAATPGAGTDGPDANTSGSVVHEPSPKRQRVNDVSINSFEDVTCLNNSVDFNFRFVTLDTLTVW